MRTGKPIRRHIIKEPAIPYKGDEKPEKSPKKPEKVPVKT